TGAIENDLASWQAQDTPPTGRPTGARHPPATASFNDPSTLTVVGSGLTEGIIQGTTAPTPVIGSGIAGFDPSSATWYLRNEASPGGVDAGFFQYGGPDWIPVVGDWNDDGVMTVGMFDPTTATWYLRNENSSGAPDAGVVQFGAPGWIPV